MSSEMRLAANQLIKRLNRRTLFLALSFAVLVSGAALAFFSGAGSFFADTGDHWAGRRISRLAARGIANGAEPGRFVPDAPVTRAQAAKLLLAALGREGAARELSGAATPFFDLRGHWAAGYAAAANEIGLFSGYGDRSFRPDQPITRAELAVVTVRSLRVSGLTPPALPTAVLPSVYQARLPGFADRQAIPAWAAGEVAEAGSRGLIQGFPDGSFRPAALASRAEMAVLVSRLLGRRGDLFDVEGTVEEVDSGAVSVKIAGRFYRLDPAAVVRGPLGENDPGAFKPYYLVRGVLGPGGDLRYLEGVLLGETGRLEAVTAALLEYYPASGEPPAAIESAPAGRPLKSVKLEAATRIFREDKPAAVSDLRRGDRIYLVRDPRRPDTAVGVTTYSRPGGDAE